MKRMKLLIVAVVVALALALSSCSISGDTVTDPSMQTLRYTGGFAQGQKYKSCLEPGTKLNTDDHLYPYPTTQREDVWDTDNYNQGSNSADHADLKVVDKDGIPVNVKMKVQFFLNTDCKPVDAAGRHFKGGTLQAFHELIGKTRHAYFNDNGTYGNGWLWAMDNYISSPVQAYVRDAMRASGAEDEWRKPEIRLNVQDDLQKKIAGLVNDGMQTDLQFYKDFKVTIFSITPDDEFLDKYKSRQAAQIEAQTAEANKQAQIAKAEADAAVAKAQAKIKQAEIDGYGGYANYRCIYLADHGLNCAQPTYVVGGTK